MNTNIQTLLESLTNDYRISTFHNQQRDETQLSMTVYNSDNTTSVVTEEEIVEIQKTMPENDQRDVFHDVKLFDENGEIIEHSTFDTDLKRHGYRTIHCGNYNHISQELYDHGKLIEHANYNAADETISSYVCKYQRHHVNSIVEYQCIYDDMGLKHGDEHITVCGTGDQPLLYRHRIANWNHGVRVDDGTTLSDENKRLIKKMAEIEEENKFVVREHHRLSEDYQKLSEKNQALTKQYENVGIRNQNLQYRNEHLGKEVQTLSDELTDERRRHAELNESLHHIRLEYQIYYDANQNIRADNDELKNKLHAALKSSNKSDRHMTKWKNEYEDMKEREDDHLRKISNLKDHIEQHKIDMEKLIREKAEVENKFNQIHPEHHSLKLLHDELKDKYNSVLTEYEQLNDTFTELEKYYAIQKKNYSSLQTEHSDIKDKYTKMETENKEIKAKLSDLLNLINNLRF